MTTFGGRLATTAIDGLTVWTLPVHGDSRGYFKENWQRSTMVAAGLDDFGPVQHNISFNDAAGVTRGIHAEPWDKFVSVATGRVFGAWVDLRAGPGFGRVVTTEIGPGTAVFVPCGVGNAYQTLEPGTAYTYLVNEHWSPEADYTFLNLADETVAIDWPIPLADAVISDKDRAHPRLGDVTPVEPRRTLVLGASGQLGRALRAEYVDDGAVEFATSNDIRLGDTDLAAARDWSRYGAVINAAAYTAVDAAETGDGRAAAWASNVAGVAELTRVCRDHRLTLVHVSSDYVFDGASERPYTEADRVGPLGVYGQTKAAGEAVVAGAPRHYVLRASWVIGEGNNFVRTMARLAAEGVDPAVVDDQVGRPTFAADLATAIRHLLTARPAYGLYHLTGGGEPASWHTIAREVFAATGHDPARVSAVSTAEYVARQQAARAGQNRAGQNRLGQAAASYPIAPRPQNSTLDLTKITATGLAPPDWREGLRRYLAASGELAGS